MRNRAAPDGNALVCARRAGARDFAKALSKARKAGFSDGEILRAMASATEMIDSIGSLALMPSPKVKHATPRRKAHA